MREHAQALLEAARIKDIESELELLMGWREEVYWEYVPEKVRALAVQRADVPGVGQGAIEKQEDIHGVLAARAVPVGLGGTNAGDD